MQFLVMAKDGSDEDALERRKRTRPTHLASIGPLVESGNVLVGGAMLDDACDMIGSMLSSTSRTGQGWTPGWPLTRT
jgi:uncharacterized protein